MAENGYTYIVQQGDTLAGIAKKYFISDWQIIYTHKQNEQFRKNNPDYRRIRVGDTLFIPSVFTMAAESGHDYLFIMPGNALFCDTHMHIQSNNCAPLPLQWAMVKREKSLRLEGARDLLNVVSGVALGRFGQIGAYSSDEIAFVYFGTGKRTAKKGSMSAMLLRRLPGGGQVFDTTKFISESVSKIFRTEKGLELLGQASEDSEVVFEKATRYYYRNNRIKSIAVSLLMDMSYSHFWGSAGLPVNIPLGKSSVFINDFVAGGITYSPDAGGRGITGGVSQPADSNLRAEFTSMTEMPLFSPAMEGWSHLFPRKLADDTFSFRDQYTRFFETRLSPKGESRLTKNSFIAFSDEPGVRDLDVRLLQKTYVHIVSDLPRKESKQFEDYEKQELRSIKAAMTYPLQLLPFYHFDPRRHVPEADRTALLDRLEGDHAFYRISSQHPYIKLTPDREMNSRAFLSGVVDMLSDVESARKELFLDPSGSRGVFWGVKMYPRLGYAPDDFKQYPQLQDFYSVCAKNKIPITVHCSRGPMCIADYVNYSRYGPKMNNPPPARSEDQIDYRRHEYWFADTFTTAANWEKVLDDDQFPDLKIDLAHFGGMDLWLQMGNFKEFNGEFEQLEENFPTDPGKLPIRGVLYGSKEEMQAQMASLYHVWVKKTAVLCEKKNNVYTDLACFAFSDDDGSVQIELVAKNLAYLINEHKKLKEKILVGSDWFMSEKGGVVGPGNYLRNMFMMLRRVSELVDTQFDAWHQFAVINPLEFLGLWVDGGMIDTELCGRYVERLAGWVGDEDLNKEKITFPASDKIIRSGSEFVRYIKGLPSLKRAEEIKDENGNLIILDNQK